MEGHGGRMPAQQRMGAQCRNPGGVEFSVWAPHARRASVVLESNGARAELDRARGGDGFFSALIERAAPRTRYRFRIDDGAPMPDPASRFQPEGPHGASEIIDLRDFAWTDGDWRGVGANDQVIYEMHVGTFTPDGTWRAALQELPRLADLGITVIEVMPLAEFPGTFGWGYDGVQFFAPFHGYGRPEDLCAFIDAAHRLNIGVVVDVVYNHFGPDGNYLPSYTRDWISDRKNEWGDAPNFDGADSAPVREYFMSNAAYWIEQFHADGLRIDATQQLFDRSPEHILRAIVRRARAAAPNRDIYIVAENQTQQPRLVRPPASGGYGCDAVWNDDFHHTLRVALSGRRDAYYSDYTGSAQEIVSCVTNGFLYQGQRSAWVKKNVGTSAHELAPSAFVHFLENHDQIANSADGARLSALTSPARLRAATALLLLGPQTPLIFQGQEYGSRQPFLFFADHVRELGEKVREGRAQFLSQFASIACTEVRATLANPGDAATFDACKLNPAQRDERTVALFRDLLTMRREDTVLSGKRRIRVVGAVLRDDAFVLRWFGHDDDDRLLLVNFGLDLHRETIAEPLLAPPANHCWQQAWCSEDLRYGGIGGYPYKPDGAWHLAANSATLLRPIEAEPPPPDGSPQ
ncbi:MAG TPA: malto-oligosyltrehalose trehalohydrolase [Rudaea sp.]|nr:malto-oligosyltrehalose trehalohydrolase [Rudaea sp.]